MKKVKVYVGCGLTHAPQEYKDEIDAFKDELKKVEWIEVLDFLGKLKPESPSEKNRPLNVYTHDIHNCVGTCQVIIADLSYPSTGLGYELATSVEKHGVRAIMCAGELFRVSDLLMGVPFHPNNPHATFHQYKKSILELLPYFLEELQKLHEE